MSVVGDHSTGGSIIGGSLKAAGFSGVVRYASSGRSDVNITAAEVRDLHVNGLQVGIVCEHTADWLLRPDVAPRVAVSRDIARAAGLPDGVIYMAVDFDVTLGGPTHPGSPGDRNMHRVLDGLNVAAGVIGRENVGFYGSKFAIDWLVSHAPWVKWFWQTLAWSMGQRNPRAQLFQRATSRKVAGVDVDIDDILQPNWGQRVLPPKPKPKPPPPVVVPRHARGIFKAELAYDHDKQHVHIQGAPGKVEDWGSVDEWLRLEVAVKVGPHGTGAWTGKVLGALPAHPPMKPPAPKGVSVPGHPELKPHISWVVNRIRDAWPRLIITSTTGGHHAAHSFHPLGRACDLGTDPFDQDYQDRAAAWTASHLTPDLVEGIHNPGLSVKDRRVVDPSFWGVQTWSAHRGHLHVAA